MLAKLSLMSFIYGDNRKCCFPNKKTKQMFEEYKVEKNFINHVFTDTDSTCLFFMLVCTPECDVVDEMFRDFIFEIIANNSVLEMFGTSHEFGEKFSNRSSKLKKKLGYFDVEHIDNPTLVFLGMNLKDYIKIFDIQNTNAEKRS